MFTGSSPTFTLSYILQSTGNTVQIQPGGTIPFPATQTNTTANATLDITNTGSGPGFISNIALTSGGPVFKITGTPLFPPGGFELPGSQNATLPIGVTYSPTAVENDTGQITITYEDGTTAVVNLTGSGATSTYTYSVLSGAGATGTPVKPPGPIVFPPANVATGTNTTNATSSVIVQVTNSGNASGTINSVTTTGPFSLSNVPNPPPTLKPGDTESFTLVFTPSLVGTQTGQLVVGSDIFTLSGQGLGSQLTFSYTSSAGTFTITPTFPSVVFSPVTISQSQKIAFTITNSGTLPTTISNIGTASSGTSNPFAVSGVSLPLALAVGQSSQFTLTFTPVTTGFANGTLQVDTTAVPLLGSGTTPPSLSSYTITGPSGTAAPQTQSGVSLTLADSYPVDLTGTLTMTTSGTVGTDPSVQFSTGGRTVDFTIPTGSTSANFAGEGSQILLQTGTVAETVTLTPTFVTSGGVDLVPSPLTTLQFTVAPAAPVLESVQISNATASTFTLLAIGYSTTRSLSTLNVTFHPASGFSLSTSTFSIDVSQVANLWFGGASSQAFGGLFQISVPFTLTGKVPTNSTLLQTLASVSATVSNAIGTSNSLQANVQ